jgi:hypothetical protein
MCCVLCQLSPSCRAGMQCGQWLVKCNSDSALVANSGQWSLADVAFSRLFELCVMLNLLPVVLNLADRGESNFCSHYCVFYLKLPVAVSSFSLRLLDEHFGCCKHCKTYVPTLCV